MVRLIVLLWPVPSLAASYVALGGSRSFWLGSYLTLALLWPASIAVWRVAGGYASVGVATVLCALHVLQLVLPAPIANRQPNVLERRFTTPQQAIRHTLRLPVGERQWNELWLRTPTPESYLYFYVTREHESADVALTVALGERPLGELSHRTIVASSREWHRLPASRSELEASHPLDIVVAPASAAQFVPGAIGLGGGFSYRPTAPPSPSAFFDGVQWSSEPLDIFPDLAAAREDFPRPGPQRFFVEVRFVDPVTRRFLAIFY